MKIKLLLVSCLGAAASLLAADPAPVISAASILAHTKVLSSDEFVGSSSRVTPHGAAKVTDEVQPDWTFAGAAQDAAFLLQVGRRIADGDTWPEWKPGNEFKAKRDAMMKQ